MKVFIATEAIMYQNDAGIFLSNSFKNVVNRYKNFFGDITLCTRVKAAGKEEVPASYDCVNGIVTDWIALNGLSSFVKGEKSSEIEDRIAQSDLVIARVPSVVAYKAAGVARKYKVPYLAEVVGCAWDSYWNYSAFGKLVAPIALVEMKKTVYRANYATYVTERFLQNRYPCRCKSIHCSNVNIAECNEAVLDRRIEKIRTNAYKEKIVLLTCAAIDVAYKGQEYVIRAIPELNKQGILVEYRMAGYGNPERLESVAKKLGVQNQVVFLGALTHDQVLETMDQSDIYIQPSLQEGLPRSVIEAMSRACPVLGARTAGIPELIDPECVFTPKSPKAIADKVRYLYNTDLLPYVKNNFDKSKEFLSDTLEKRRKDYYEMVISELPGLPPIRR